MKSTFEEIRLFITHLKNSNKTISDKEFILILNEIKLLCINSEFIDLTLKSIKVLNQTQIRHKHSLTKREKDVLSLIGKGYKNQAIANQLELSVSTVETHRKNIRKRLKLSSSDHLLVYALLFNLQNQNLTFDDNS